MKESSIGIAKEGYPIIGLFTLATVVCAIVSCEIGALIFLLLVWFSVFFFRDPERVIPMEQGLAVSPADGKIIRIHEAPDPFTGKNRQCISVFMNVFSVHVNRAPVAGTIDKIKYIPGKFINAAFDKASTDNERCAYSLIDTDKKEWAFVQISGLIARRIVCRADEKDKVTRGERFGLIRFGSRVDLYLPEGYSSAVHIGEQVFAGQSVLAKKDAKSE